jgi:hypothetical protein
MRRAQIPLRQIDTGDACLAPTAWRLRGSMPIPVCLSTPFHRYVAEPAARLLVVRRRPEPAPDCDPRFPAGRVNDPASRGEAGPTIADG